MIDANYRPGALIVRLSHIDKGEACSRITLDSSADAANQQHIAHTLGEIGQAMARVHGLRVPKGAQWEVLAGRTANQIDRMEDLLNDCRNLLIDLQPDEQDGSETAKRIEAMLADLDAELGL